MMGTFAALAEAMAAYVQRDAERFTNAVASVPPERLYAQAARHKCAAILFDGIARFRVRDRGVAPLRTALQHYVTVYALEAEKTRAQIVQIAALLSGAGVEHVLLKSAARLYAGDTLAERSQIFDIDVLIESARAEAALTALQQAGYAYLEPEFASEYRLHHHHLAPLASPQFSKPLELHTALAPAGHFSTGTDWGALKCYHEPAAGADGTALRLNRFGRSLHMAVHGVGLHRLGDVVLVASDLRDEPGLLERLLNVTQMETIQRIPLQAVLCLATRFAGMEAEFDTRVHRFVSWAQEREDLAPRLRGRMGLADAWFANGGRLRGPATALAIPKLPACSRVLAGRVLAGMYVAAFRRRMFSTQR